MHVFLSYARNDANEANQLASALVANGFNVWIDATSLPPGAPQWEKEIRQALGNSLAVIAICSAASRDSEYVAIELAIAKGLGKSIVPVWLTGDIWTENSPLALVMSQYIDLREASRAQGFRALAGQLAAFARQAPQHDKTSAIEWPIVVARYKSATITMNPFTYKSRGLLLTDIYLNLLQTVLPAHTYGKRWAIDLSPKRDWDVYGDHEIEAYYGSYRFLWLPATWAKTPSNARSEHHTGWMDRTPDLWPGFLLARQRRSHLAPKAPSDEKKLIDTAEIEVVEILGDRPQRFMSDADNEPRRTRWIGGGFFRKAPKNEKTAPLSIANRQLSLLGVRAGENSGGAFVAGNDHLKKLGFDLTHMMNDDVRHRSFWRDMFADNGVPSVEGVVAVQNIDRGAGYGLTHLLESLRYKKMRGVKYSSKDNILSVA